MPSQFHCVLMCVTTFFCNVLCDLPSKRARLCVRARMCVCVRTLPVSAFECRDPVSRERGKGPSSFSQESSANHFLRFCGKKKNGGKGKRLRKENKGGKEKEESIPVEWLNRPSVIWHTGLELHPNYALLCTVKYPRWECWALPRYWF